MNETPQSVSMEAKLVVNPNMVLRVEDDDCAILCDPDSGRLRVLNPTAVHIWKLIDGNRTLTEVVRAVEETFDCFGTQAQEQVVIFVQSLYKVGAVGTVSDLLP